MGSIETIGKKRRHHRLSRFALRATPDETAWRARLLVVPAWRAGVRRREVIPFAIAARFWVQEKKFGWIASLMAGILTVAKIKQTKRTIIAWICKKNDGKEGI